MKKATVQEFVHDNFGKEVKYDFQGACDKEVKIQLPNVVGLYL